MKILFVIDTLGSGGKERRLTELLKALILRQNIDFELAVMSNNIHYKEVQDLGITIHTILRTTKKDISVFGKFYHLIRNYKPDIVHCWDSMTAVYVALVCKVLHCRFVNGMVIDSPVKQNIFNKDWLRARLTFPFSNIIVSNSEAGLIAYKALKTKSVVIHNGFSFDRIENLMSKEIIRKELGIITDYIVGMVATFSERKDYPTYFRAAQILLEKRRDLTFIAIGTGTDSEESIKNIDNKNLDNFRLLGEKYGIESLINAMDLCILSTFTEGISNSILEYMALGKPVIATRGGGTSEIVKDGVSGFLVNPSDPLELSEKIEKLLSDSQLRENMGSEGGRRVREEFAMEQMVNKYIGVYTNLLSD